jgi:hypothetical protein
VKIEVDKESMFQWLPAWHFRYAMLYSSKLRERTAQSEP